MNSFQYNYTLLVRDGQERCTNGLVSIRDLAGTRRLALSVLRLDHQAASIDIHIYAPHATELENREPVARVTLDDETEE